MSIRTESVIQIGLSPMRSRSSTRSILLSRSDRLSRVSSHMSRSLDESAV